MDTCWSRMFRTRYYLDESRCYCFFLSELSGIVGFDLNIGNLSHKKFRVGHVQSVVLYIASHSKI